MYSRWANNIGIKNSQSLQYRMALRNTFCISDKARCEEQPTTLLPDLLTSSIRYPRWQIQGILLLVRETATVVSQIVKNISL
jgi:hypothetical protein